MRDGKAYYNRRERQQAKDLAKRQPVSGAMPFFRGDIKHGDVLLDMKDYADRKQFTVKLEQVDKIRQEAYGEGCSIGGLLIVINKRRFYVFDADDLERMANRSET